MTTVRELIETLSKVDPDLEILVSNGFIVSDMSGPWVRLGLDIKEYLDTYINIDIDKDYVVIEIDN
jgi:hypothetical protein